MANPGYPGGGMGGPSRSGFSIPNPSAEDIEKQDPVKLLLDKHKKLKLDKTQVAELTTLHTSLARQNQPYYQRVDSLHKTFKAPSSGFQRSSGSDGDRAAFMENRELFRDAVTQIRANNKAATDSAVLLLKEPQKKKAYDMLEKQLEESDKMLHEPGRGSMGGGRRGQSPPA